MTFTKESNKEMEKVMMLMDMGILPLEDKDGVINTSQVTTEDELIADANEEFKEFLFRDKAYSFSWKDMFGEEHYEYGEEGCFANADHYEYTLKKNRRAERRRQMHKHKKATVNGKTVKAYGKEGKVWLNNDERIAYGKKLINGKFVDVVKEAEQTKNALTDTNNFSWIEFMKEFECEYSTSGDDTFVNPWRPWKRPNFSAEIGETVGTLEWTKKFKEFLSLEEILDMFF
jgi:hypothetical protein